LLFVIRSSSVFAKRICGSEPDETSSKVKPTTENIFYPSRRRLFDLGGFAHHPHPSSPIATVYNNIFLAGET
jgi:hypothetical protein